MWLPAPDRVFVELDLLAAHTAINHRTQLAIAHWQRQSLPRCVVAGRRRGGEPDAHRAGIGEDGGGQEKSEYNREETHAITHKFELKR